MRTPWLRRDFLASSMALSAGLTPFKLRAFEASTDRVAFFLVGDTHYLANEESPEQLDDRSLSVTSGLIETLNKLPGTAIPDSAGGGVVAQPQGLVHAGDLIDSGDKNGSNWEKMQATEWKAFTSDFGIDGTDGRLKFPVFEVYGNHDGPQGKGLAIEGIASRSRKRTGMTKVSPNGLHYSWDWGPFHFVNLGITVGQNPDVTQRRRYQPMDSLNFLIDDLKENVGLSGRPVILTHHIDVVRYSVPCVADDPANVNREWHPCDVQSYYETIRDYNVIAVLYGHTHARNILFWNGESTRAEQGISLFNVDNSSHFKLGQQSFFYFELTDSELRVRECTSPDSWQSFEWTPQLWMQPIRLG
jgi:Calcineurin-like phosphoesterase